MESTLETVLVGRCLEMWQALSYAKPVTGDLVRAWQLAMARHHVTEAEFREAAQRLLDRREFPAPADALEIVGRLRFEAARLDPPCIEVLDERGGVRLASRAASEGLARPALGPTSSRSLPREDLVGPLARRFGNLMKGR